MSTLAEKIKVMQAFENGEVIEFRYLHRPDWAALPNPVWDWSQYEYRVKPKPVERWFIEFREEPEHRWTEATLKTFPSRIAAAAYCAQIWDGHAPEVRFIKYVREETNDE